VSGFSRTGRRSVRLQPDARTELTYSLMPFKSQAQRRKFAQLLVEGKISNQTFEEWNRETGRKKLPERVTHERSKKAPAKRKTRKAAARPTRVKKAR
jgi:CRISPR/Cas system-associated endonuclease Cas1